MTKTSDAGVGGTATRSGIVLGRRFGSRQQRVWVVVAVLLVIGGCVGAVLAAGVQSRDDRTRARAAFVSSSADLASTLELAIQHEQDLVVSARGYVVGRPRSSNAEFRRWASSVGALARYRELVSIGVLEIVPASRLAGFAAAAQRDPAGFLSAGGVFRVLPTGARSFYCLTAANVTRGLALPAGSDYCAAEPLRSSILAGVDAGRTDVRPYRLGSRTLLTISTPVYRGGGIPATSAARRHAFVAIVAMTVDPGVVLARALAGHPDTALTFRYRSGSSNLPFRAGKVTGDAWSASFALPEGWTVRASAAVPATGIVADESARTQLLGGIVLSLLLGLLVYLLGTGRARAMRMVGLKTGELQHQAMHDGLTGLPNRLLVMDRIDQLLARNRRHATMGAVLFVDLDEFKNVNDTLGHDAGDRLLMAVSDRFQNTLRDADTIGRMGGDEFVVLLDGAALTVAPELVAERLLAVMRQPFELDGTSMPLTVNTSIGIAMGDRATAGELLRDADVALYQAKGNGKNRYEIFHPEMHTDISRRIELEFDLRGALNDDQFRLEYQPIYNLDQLTIVGVEALLRWQHPDRGTVGPDEFIPILEQTGQISDVGGWVLDTACKQMATWRARGDTLDLSVNVSGRQLDHDAIIEQIRHALDTSGLPASALIIEVTETALMRNADDTARRLHAIKQLGIRIAVDDFGTGYSSLAYLQRFPVDCLKIDRSFTDAISTSPESKALIGTLVQLGKDLGLTTLAEGLETTGQMDHLRDEHVTQAQGFLLSRPLDPDTLETQLLIPTRPPVHDSHSPS
jgi:diguanylate cyclase (GGDEF)-like protein